MHNHSHVCEHTLKYCGICDVVYCEKCGSEWKKPVYYWTYPNVTYPNGTGVQDSQPNFLVGPWTLSYNTDHKHSPHLTSED